MIEYSTKKRVYQMDFRIDQSKIFSLGGDNERISERLRLTSWGVGGLKCLGQDEEDYRGEMKA